MNVTPIKIYCIAGMNTCSEIHQLFKDESRVDFVGFSDDVFGAIFDSPKLNANIILIHNEPPKREATRILEELREKIPDGKFIILLSEGQDFWKTLESRADAFLMWPTQWLNTAIEIVMNNGIWLGPRLSQYLLREQGFDLLTAKSSAVALPKSVEQLSNREKEVLHFLLRGSTNKEIAEALGLRIGTVKVHVNHILSKLHFEHRGQVIARLTRY